MVSIPSSPPDHLTNTPDIRCGESDCVYMGEFLQPAPPCSIHCLTVVRFQRTIFVPTRTSGLGNLPDDTHRQMLLVDAAIKSATSAAVINESAVWGTEQDFDSNILQPSEKKCDIQARPTRTFNIKNIRRRHFVPAITCLFRYLYSFKCNQEIDLRLAWSLSSKEGSPIRLSRPFQAFSSSARLRCLRTIES